MTPQGHMDNILNEQSAEQGRKKLTITHINFLNNLAQLCGGMEGLKTFIWDMQRAIGELTPKEIIRALERENKLKEHYEGTGFKPRGGRRNRVKGLFDEVKDWGPEHQGWKVKNIARLYGSHAAPGTRLSLTSQWRLNKKLKEAGLPPVPWRSIKPIMDEGEFEQAVMKYNREHHAEDEARQAKARQVHDEQWAKRDAEILAETQAEGSP